MNNKYKIILVIAFILSLLIGARYSYGQTTTVTVNGNTTTTTTITNTPVSTTVVPNTPNIGDLTTTTINQTTTDVMTKVANTNSGNLVSTNFCDNSWTGTQKTSNPSGQTSDLGCNYITGKVGGTYLQTEKNLTSAGITKPEQNLGFTQSSSAYTHHFWGWNSWLNFSHSVINNDTGQTLTQNRTWDHNNSIPGSTKSLDNIIIGENSASGYTSKMRFDLLSSGGGATWQGVDISNPNLSITYNKLTSTSSSLQTTTTEIIPCATLGTCYVAPVIEKIDEKFIEVIKEAVKIEEAVNITAFAEVFKEEMKVEVSTTIETMEPTKIDSPVMSSMMNTMTEEPKATTSVSDSPTVSMKEEPKTTTTVVNEEPKTTTTVASEEPKSTTIAKEETTSTKMTSEEPKETTTSTKESNATTSSDKETTSVSEKTNTNTDTKSEESKTTTSQSATNENQKAEGSQTEKANEKVVSDKSVTTNEKGTVNVGVNSIETKVKTAIEKVEREVKSIDQKTRAIQEIKLEGLKSGAPNLSVYENKNFYDPRQMVGTPNPDFFNQINIEQQQIYKDVSLSAYTNRDPIAVKQALQMEIEEEMNKLILEIEILKRS